MPTTCKLYERYRVKIPRWFSGASNCLEAHENGILERLQATWRHGKHCDWALSKIRSANPIRHDREQSFYMDSSHKKALATNAASNGFSGCLQIFFLKGSNL